MHVTSRLHVAQDVILKLANRLERVRNILILLDVTDDFGGLGPFSEVDEVGALNNRWDTVLNKGQVREVYPCIASVYYIPPESIEPTEERDTWRIGEMQRFSVFSKILRAAHELPHLFQNIHRPGVDLIPCPTQPMYWSSS